MNASLERLLAQAEHDLQSASRGAPLCRITAAGAPARDIKFAEGRWAALRALARATAPEADDAALSDRAALLLSEWQADLQRWNSQPASSWIPYCEGGVAALTDLLSES